MRNQGKKTRCQEQKETMMADTTLSYILLQIMGPKMKDKNKCDPTIRLYLRSKAETETSYKGRKKFPITLFM